MFLLLNTFGIVSIWYRPSNSAATTNPTVVSYSLQWQNQNGTPFTITDISSYQFINIDLSLSSYSNFTQNDLITMNAQGTMSQSLANSSLAYIEVIYDGAIPYPANGGFTGAYGLGLNVVPNGTGSYAFGPTVGLHAEPKNITWAFTGGPHFPTLDLHYWNGEDITKEYTGAPIMVQASLPSPPTHDTPELIAVNWVIGGTIIVIIEAIYLRFPRKSLPPT